MGVGFALVGPGGGLISRMAVVVSTYYSSFLGGGLDS